LLPLLLAFPLHAAELEGVTLEDRVRVDGQPLQLNGIALRTRMVFFKVYVAGLYLPERITTAPAVLAAKGAKRIHLTMVRDATAEQFVESILTGMRLNHGEAELEAVQTQTDELMAMIRKAAFAPKGTSIVLDYAPSEGGTTLFIDGKAAGRPMAGEEFFRVLLRIWLGEHPAQEDLKDALLGGVQ
jgi:hypothetical protein